MSRIISKHPIATPIIKFESSVGTPLKRPGIIIPMAITESITLLKEERGIDSSRLSLNSTYVQTHKAHTPMPATCPLETSEESKGFVVVFEVRILIITLPTVP